MHTIRGTNSLQTGNLEKHDRDLSLGISVPEPRKKRRVTSIIY